jgi:hypothetical protein
VDKLEKEANIGGYLKGLGLLGLGGATGSYLMDKGPASLDRVGQVFSENIYDPAYRAVSPITSHIGSNLGKYLGGGLSLAALLATKGQSARTIPLLATAGAGLAGGTWWDNSRRDAAADKILWEQKLDMDKEKWRNWEDTEDPYELPSAPPDFGQTGWRPSAAPVAPLTP